MMHGFGYGNLGTFGWISMIFNLVITLIVIGGIIWSVVWLVRKGIPNNQLTSRPSQLGPKEILQSRYVRGEISREEYKQILDDLI